MNDTAWFIVLLSIILIGFLIVAREINSMAKSEIEMHNQKLKDKEETKEYISQLVKELANALKEGKNDNN